MAQVDLSGTKTTQQENGPIEARLLEVLACPACYGALSNDGQRVVCPACGAAYDCPEHLPVLLLPEMVKHAHALEASFQAEKLSRNAVVRLGYKLRPPVSHFDPAAFKRMRAMVAKLGPGARVMDLGVRERPAAPGLISFDLFRFPGVQVVGDAHRLPFGTAALDGIISTALLEHVEHPEPILAEMRRVVRPGGLVYVEVPFLQGYHPDPIDMRRYTQPGLEQKVSEAGFTIVESGVSGGPFSMLAWMLREFPGSLTTGKTAYFVAKFISGWLTFWVKYLDAFARRASNAHILADGFYVLGQCPKAAEND